MSYRLLALISLATAAPAHAQLGGMISSTVGASGSLAGSLGGMPSAGMPMGRSLDVMGTVESRAALDASLTGPQRALLAGLELTARQEARIRAAAERWAKRSQATAAEGAQRTQSQGSAMADQGRRSGAMLEGRAEAMTSATARAGRDAAAEPAPSPAQQEADRRWLKDVRGTLTAEQRSQFDAALAGQGGSLRATGETTASARAAGREAAPTQPEGAGSQGSVKDAKRPD